VYTLSERDPPSARHNQSIRQTRRGVPNNRRWIQGQSHQPGTSSATSMAAARFSKDISHISNRYRAKGGGQSRHLGSGAYMPLHARLASITRCCSLPFAVHVLPAIHTQFNYPHLTTAMSNKAHSTESIASTTIVLDWTFTSLAIFVVGLRIYTRMRLVNGLGLEDLAIFASVVSTHMP
jgi:hypothetical protein